jgi:SNF2 family DNA or RNA helicase
MEEMKMEKHNVDAYKDIRMLLDDLLDLLIEATGERVLSSTQLVEIIDILEKCGDLAVDAEMDL